MNTIQKLTGTFLLSLLLVACGSSVKEKKGETTDKKVQLEKLKGEQAKLNKQIADLQEELGKTDSSQGTQNAKLVVITPVAAAKFQHYIDLQGRIDAENSAFVTPRGQGGQVTAIYVKQGDRVQKGQLLVKLYNALTDQQIEQVKIQLSLAETLYQRRKNLWDQQIGTEIELLQAKSNVDNLKKQIDLLNEQKALSDVHAEISGIVDIVNIKVGEVFTPATAATAGIHIVNTDKLKVTTQVPENYMHKVEQGANIIVTLPDINKTVNTVVSVKGSTIDPNSRTFYIEAKLPKSNDFKPNQIALVKIQDYSAANAISIPMNTLQNDEKGKFVMVAAQENGKTVARKRNIEVGELYGNDLEVKSGLQANDQLITEGFQGLYDGQAVTTKS